MVQSADHVTGLTGATVTVTLSKSGGSFASPSGAVSEIGSGWYKVAGNATDTATLGPLALHATAASGDPTDDRFDVVAFDPQSATAFIVGINSLAPPTNWNATALDSSGRMMLNPAQGAVTFAGFVSNATTMAGAISGVTLAASQAFNNTGQTTAVPTQDKVDDFSLPLATVVDRTPGAWALHGTGSTLSDGFTHQNADITAPTSCVRFVATTDDAFLQFTLNVSALSPDAVVEQIDFAFQYGITVADNETLRLEGQVFDYVVTDETDLERESIGDFFPIVRAIAGNLSDNAATGQFIPAGTLTASQLANYSFQFFADTTGNNVTDHTDVGGMAVTVRLKTTIPSASDNASAVDTLLTANHGSGSWTGAGGGNVIITPILATTTNPRYSTRDLPPIAQGSTPAEAFAIVDGSATPVNLSGKDLRFVVCAEVNCVLEVKFTYETGAGITISGENNNIVTVQHNASDTGTVGCYIYFLWNVTDKLLLVKGQMPIEPAKLSA